MSTPTTEKLEFLKVVAQIASVISSITIPLVLAGIGFLVQRSFSEAGLKKDYVQISLAILKEQPTKDNEELREWAITVLDSNSPVPIPLTLRTKLVSTKMESMIWSKIMGDDNIRYSLVESINRDLAKKQGESSKEPIECKPAPNSEIVDWLVKNYPSKFTRCPNGEIGERPSVISITKDLNVEKGD